MAKTTQTKTTKRKTKPAKAAGRKTASSRAARAGAAPQPKESKAKGRAPLIEKTLFVKWGTETPTWHVIDASGQALGRLSSHIAQLLMGKHKAQYTRFADTGDHVIVINAKAVLLTGNKNEAKLYHHHTGYVGGIKTSTAAELRDRHPERLIESAVYGMLPKGHMGRRWYKKLRVFGGAEHTHQAQKPTASKLPSLGARAGGV